MEVELAAVLLEARSEADKQIAQASEQLNIQVQTRFPRRSKSDPMYEQLRPYRESYQKLKDLARTYPHRTRYLEQAKSVLRNAWSLL